MSQAIANIEYVPTTKMSSIATGSGDPDMLTLEERRAPSVSEPKHCQFA